MQFKIGQVWSVTWVDGDEALPSHGRTTRTRTGILTGAEAIDGKTANLHFSLPMIEGRKNNIVTATELDTLYLQGEAKILGEIPFVAPNIPDEDAPDSNG
jgi:hypothetical protein